MPVTVIARRVFEHDGTPVAVGQRLCVSALQAVRLLSRGDARWPRRSDGEAPTTRAVERPAPVAESAAAAPKRRTRRRDLTAETIEKPKRTRTYRRRDMEAE